MFRTWIRAVVTIAVVTVVAFGVFATPAVAAPSDKPDWAPTDNETAQTPHTKSVEAMKASPAPKDRFLQAKKAFLQAKKAFDGNVPDSVDATMPIEDIFNK